MSKFKTLLFSDFHAKPFDEKRPHYSKWEFEMKKYCLDIILKTIKEESITRVIDLGDFIDRDSPKSWELDLLDYFWSNVPNEVSKEIIWGNHSLNKQSTKRLYYEEVMKDYYLNKWNVKVHDYVIIGESPNQDIFCSHKYINKLQNLNKKYRYIFSHLRSSNGNAFFSDEINLTIPKNVASKIYLGDVHNHSEFDNIVYCGQSSWVEFPQFNEEESKVSSIPSFILLDEDSGEHERVFMFNQDSPYQKKLKHIKLEDLDNIPLIIEEMRQDYLSNKAFYKVRVYGKKFMIDKVKRTFREQKDIDKFCITEYINLSMNESNHQQINYNKLVKQCLDKNSVSKDLLNYICKTNDDKGLEDLVTSTFATLESMVENKR